MSSLHRALGHPEPLALDDATLRRIERVYRRVQPDPLFRRRLRGEVVNRYVAEREGYLRRPRARRHMGSLGRAVLYASLGVAVSVSAAGAAADRSLPGDLLYGVKLQLEDVRMRIAPPSVHDDLAAMMLAERVDELERLAAAGSWSLVPAAVARVTSAEEALLALDPTASAGSVSQAAEALEDVLAGAPPQAREGLERALAAMAPHARAPRQPHPELGRGPHGVKPGDPPGGRPAGLPPERENDDRDRGPNPRNEPRDPEPRGAEPSGTESSETEPDDTESQDTEPSEAEATDEEPGDRNTRGRR